MIKVIDKQIVQDFDPIWGEKNVCCKLFNEFPMVWFWITNFNLASIRISLTYTIETTHKKEDTTQK